MVEPAYKEHLAAYKDTLCCSLGSLGWSLYTSFTAFCMLGFHVWSVRYHKQHPCEVVLYWNIEFWSLDRRVFYFKFIFTESFEEVCWFSKTRCNHKGIINVTVFLLYGIYQSLETYDYNYEYDYLKTCHWLQSIMNLWLPQLCSRSYMQCTGVLLTFVKFIKVNLMLFSHCIQCFCLKSEITLSYNIARTKVKTNYVLD